MPKLPDPFSIKPTKEQVKITREIIDAIFKDPQVKYGLREFSKLKNKLPRPYGRGISLFQTSFALNLFCPVLQYTSLSLPRLSLS